MANTYQITLDVHKGKMTVNAPVALREGDSGTATIVATILDNGATYSGMTSAQFFAQKPDGTAVATDPATVSGNTITYKVNDNLTTASGHIVNAYFLINKSVSTESFEINIHPSITLHGPSKDYIPGLNDLTRIWQQTINEWQGKFDELKAQLENTDYSQVIKDSLNSTLDEAKEAYQGEFNSAVADVNKTVKTLQDKGVEADTEIAKLKTKQDNAETVADSLQATVDQLNKKILDIDNWLDSLHDEFTAKNETYMKSMQAELTKKLADMKASSDSALNTVKGNISTAQKDITGIDNKVDSQATDVKNKFDAIKAQLDALEVPEIGGRNLLVMAEAEKDKMISPEGNIETYLGCSLMKDFIPVTSGEKLVFQRWGTQVIEGKTRDDLFRYAYYDTDKNLIKRNTAGYDEVARDVVPNGASLMRVSYASNLQVKLERGTVPTDWTPAPEDVQTAITNALDKTAEVDSKLANYSTSSEVDSKISTIDTNYVKKSELNTLIATALKDYLKTADLKQANYDAGFHSDWYGTEAEYNAITTKDAHVNYHTKEEG